MDDVAVARDEEPGGDLVVGVEPRAAPSTVRCAMSAAMLREYANRRRLRPSTTGNCPAPMSVTPLSVTTVVSATMPSTLPPCGPAARSTTTEPGRSAATASAHTRTGGRRPGTCAVVMTTSNLAIAPRHGDLLASRSSSVSSRCVAARTAGGTDPPRPQIEEGRSRRQHVAAGGVAHVGTGDDRAEPPCGADAPAGRRPRRRARAPRPVASCRRPS